jgi:hypothetical protein
MTAYVSTIAVGEREIQASLLALHDAALKAEIGEPMNSTNQQSPVIADNEALLAVETSEARLERLPDAGDTREAIDSWLKERLVGTPFEGLLFAYEEAGLVATRRVGENGGAVYWRWELKDAPSPGAARRSAA